MSNWKQKIEAQIVVTDARGDYINQHSSVDSNMHYDSAETMRLLLDVVVAAEQVHNNPFTGKGYWLELTKALDKLRDAL